MSTESTIAEKVTLVVEVLRAFGAHVRVHRRQLTHRKKVYLNVVTKGGYWEWRKIVMPAIHQYFPDAYMTSGSFSNFNYPDSMNVTIALEK